MSGTIALAHSAARAIHQANCGPDVTCRYKLLQLQCLGRHVHRVGR